MAAPRHHTRLAPTTLTSSEQKALLEATRSSKRDHTLVSLAIGTGLRLQELLGLDVGDVAADGRTVRTLIKLPPETTKGKRGGEVFLPRRLATKLERYLRWRRRQGSGADGPLFVSQHGNRLSKRRIQQVLHSYRRSTRNAADEGLLVAAADLLTP